MNLTMLSVMNLALPNVMILLCKSYDMIAIKQPSTVPKAHHNYAKRIIVYVVIIACRRQS